MTDTAKYLSLSERATVDELHDHGQTAVEIADAIGKPPSYVSKYLTNRKNIPVAEGCFDVNSVGCWVTGHKSK